MFGVHGIGGYVGTIGVGIFGSAAWGGTSGLIEGNAAQLGIQLAGCAIVTVYCGALTFGILKVIEMVQGLRVSRETEIEGLDLGLHGSGSLRAAATGVVPWNASASLQADKQGPWNSLPFFSSPPHSS